MQMIDVMLSSAITAAVLVNAVAIYAQKKWSLFDLFIGKKHAYLVYVGLVSLTCLEVVGVSVFIPMSKWSFTSVWYLGIFAIYFAVKIFASSIKESGAGAIVRKDFFDERTPKKLGPVHKKYKYPVYGSYVLFYIGLGLCFGQYGYILAALWLLICLGLLTFVEKPKRVSKHN